MLVASHRRPRMLGVACARLLSCALAGVACSAPSASSPAASSEPALPMASGLPTSAGSPDPPQSVTLEGSPAADAVLAVMRLVNAHFVATWPDPTIDIVTDRARPSNLWTRAVYFEGLMALHAVEPDRALKASYYDYAVRW